MRSKPRIILIGQGATTQSAIAALRGRFDILVLVRSGDDHVVAEAKDSGIFVESNCSIVSITRLVSSLRPDAVVISSYHRILPADLISQCPFINVHYSPLPRYRGHAPVNWAILNGETETAITVHMVEPELDAGNILAQTMIPIGSRDTAGDLYRRLNEVQERILADAVDKRLRGDPGQLQDNSLATYACVRLPSDGKIDWSRSATSIDRLIRSLGDPFRAAFTFLGEACLEVHRARPIDDSRIYVGRVPGRILRINHEAGEVEIMAGEGMLVLETIAAPGRPAQNPAEIIRSVRTTLGDGAIKFLEESRERFGVGTRY